MQVLRIDLIHSLDAFFKSNLHRPLLAVLLLYDFLQPRTHSGEIYVHRLLQLLVDTVAVGKLLSQRFELPIRHISFKLAVNHVFGPFLAQLSEQCLFLLLRQMHLLHLTITFFAYCTFL